MAENNKVQIDIVANNKASAALAEVKTGLVGLEPSVKSLTGIVGTLQTALFAGGFAMLARDVFQAGVAADKLNNSLKAAGGNAADMQFLKMEAQRLGLDLTSAGEAYVKLQAASKGTRIEGQEAQKVFTAVSEAATSLGLSSDQTSGALTALQQMISKGTVQAEELRGQLGERLPGAFQIAARAMGVSTAELGKMLESGKVLADDFIPKFTKQLQKEFPASAESMKSATADLNRFKTGMFELKTEIWDSGMKSVATGFLGFMGESAKALANTTREIREQVSWYGKLRAAGMGRWDALNFTGYNPDALSKMGSEEKAFGMAAADRRARALLNPASAPAGKKGKENNGSVFWSPGFMNWRADQEGQKAESEYITRREAADKESLDRQFQYKYGIVEYMKQATIDGYKADVAAREADAEHEMQIETQKYENFVQVEQQREDWRQRGLESQAQVESRKQQMEMDTANNAINLLNILGTKNKGFAMAALIASKGLAMAQTFINFKVAEAQTLAQVGYIVGMPLVAQLEAMMWTNMALIGATGIAQVAMGGGGGGGGASAGSYANPMVTQPVSNNTGMLPSNITIHVEGNVVAEDRWVEERLAPIIKDLANRRNVDFGLATA